LELRVDVGRVIDHVAQAEGVALGQLRQLLQVEHRDADSLQAGIVLEVPHQQPRRSLRVDGLPHPGRLAGTARTEGGAGQRLLHRYSRAISDSSAARAVLNSAPAAYMEKWQVSPRSTRRSFSNFTSSSAARMAGSVASEAKEKG